MKKSKIKSIIGVVLFTLFTMIGILNIIYVHLVPGLLYILFSLIYLPATSTRLELSLKASIPFIAKVILAVIVLWATLGVGDLMEVFEAWHING